MQALWGDTGEPRSYIWLAGMISRILFCKMVYFLKSTCGLSSLYRWKCLYGLLAEGKKVREAALLNNEHCSVRNEAHQKENRQGSTESGQEHRKKDSGGSRGSEQAYREESRTGNREPAPLKVYKRWENTCHHLKINRGHMESSSEKGRRIMCLQSVIH